MLAYATVHAVVLAIVGAETPVAAITREVCRDVLSVLKALPPNASKRWPQLDPRQAAQKASLDRIAPMSAANVNGYMNKFSALLNWAVREELIARNPAIGLRIADPIAPRNKRNPFTIEQLQCIFDAPIFRGCQDDEQGYAIVGNARPRRARFWVPLIGLYSGLRQNEICQLDTNDVRVIDEVTCFVVTARGGSNKRLKTAASERIVPLHSMLADVGFHAYTAARRASGDQKLFPELETDAFGYYSVKFSKWFSRFLLSCGASADRTCFHSLRHCFRDGLREARVDREIALALGGWTRSATGDGGTIADAYGKGFTAARLQEAIEKVSYSGLNLSHLTQSEY